MSQDQTDGLAKGKPKRVVRAKAVVSEIEAKAKPLESVSIPKTTPVKQGGQSNYPRHSLEKALRIPKAILEQNAGKESTDVEAAKFLGITNIKGPFSVQLS
jgi:hypothetical protein